MKGRRMIDVSVSQDTGHGTITVDVDSDDGIVVVAHKVAGDDGFTAELTTIEARFLLKVLADALLPT